MSPIRIVIAELVPAIVCAAVVLATRLGGRDSPRGQRGAWVVGLALAVSYAAGHVWIAGWPALPPGDAAGWLVYFALLGAGLGLLEELRRAPTWVRVVMRIALAGALVWLVVRRVEQHEAWTVGESVGWLVGLTLVITLTWISTDALTARAAPWFVPLMLLLVAGGTAAVFAIGTSVKFFQLAGMLAAALGAFLALLWSRQGPASMRTGVAVCIVVLSGLRVLGVFYADLPRSSAALLALALLTGWLGWLRPLRRLKPWQSAALSTAAVLAPILLAIARAARQSVGSSG